MAIVNGDILPFFGIELLNMFEKASLILLVTTRASSLSDRTSLHMITRRAFND
jgi:hypothetical protein